MSYKPLYTAVATADGGRNGHVESSDGIINLDLSVPKEMGGPGKPGTSNPEQLFASGYSACFAGAVGFVSNRDKIKTGPVSVTGHVTFGTEDDGHFRLAAQLDVSIADVDKEVAETLVKEAHQICPYSRATRNNIDVKLVVV